MKIIFLTAEPPWPLDQGDKVRNFHLLKAIATKHEVTFVCFCPPEEKYGKWRELLSSLCHAVYTVPLSRGQMLINVLRLPHLPVTMAARTSARMVQLLRHLTSCEDYDISFACQLKMAGYLRYCTTRRRVADLTDMVSLFRRRMLRFAPSWLGKAFDAVEAYRLAYWEKWVARLADLVLLVSPVDAAELARMTSRTRVAILPNGVDLDYFQPLPDPGKPTLIFWGHLRYPPNADGIIWFCRKVFPLIREAVPEATLLVVGKEPPPEVASLAHIHGVELLGYVPDLRTYLAQASVVVVPLRFGSGIRNKILEALASGRALVSTSLGCEGLEVTPGVHLEVADEPAEFAAKVIDLLCNPSRRAAFSANGRKLVEEKYSWEAVGEKLFELFRDNK
ncbi:GDP-mannose-dependent alpha-(1-6)-phosphatidylinositol monomannoside mannosyltransferase [Fervidicola ferrireducens]|uniref:GDP-mannose-dependent alpha-(1-6)-phosphatidylinositol monomannoside mannosyltransferase n=1 Tax=Fervidicola ferrireducens TaxID=520764 RepID=A0A140LCS2_9FIRM|nr:glycosyltransferase [Fervidicola ferrireducens]KXG78347.1 GDP-mannose-dependent alpha-(1-6)-phosphatidylinositol monomannoside mannosyltransferase [Fervidicola ferrireducens]